MSGWLNKKVAQSFSECHATSLTAAYREYCHYFFQLEFHKPSTSNECCCVVRSKPPEIQPSRRCQPANPAKRRLRPPTETANCRIIIPTKAHSQTLVACINMQMWWFWKHKQKKTNMTPVKWIIIIIISSSSKKKRAEREREMHIRIHEAHGGSVALCLPLKGFIFLHILND